MKTQQILDLHVNPSDETIRVGTIAIRFLITAEDSGGSVALFEGIVPGGQRPAVPAHSHNDYEETVYVTGGIVTFTVDGKGIDIGPVQALCIPRGAIHRFDNNGAEDAKAVCVVTPAAIGPEFHPGESESQAR